MHALPETILQFGSGKFLRGFADLFIHQANAAGQNVGQVVVVQTTGDGRANALADQEGRYHVVVRGLQDGATIDRLEACTSIRRAVFAGRQWDEVLAVARSPHLRYILSNTAETGYDLDPADHADQSPPRSFPAKLLLVLQARHAAGLPGVHLLPCELFEQNADKLRTLVLDLATRWQFPAALGDWLQNACVWHNALVDRIVTQTPLDDPRLQGDALYVMAEPYALWAIEAKPGELFTHPALRVVPDVRPFFLRKVRLLNAAHTAMVTKAAGKPHRFVREAMDDPEIVAWLERLLFDEVVPLLEDRVEEPATFARQTLERFRNPFLDHKISDIQTYQTQKATIRLVPTRDEYRAKHGRTPPLLQEAIEASGLT